MIFLQAWYSLLLLAHLLATFLLVGIMTHHLRCVGGYLRGRFGRETIELRYLRVTWWTYLAVYVLGTLAYPAFGACIRRPVLDPQFPWATGLFEVKEHWSALALAMLTACVLLRRRFLPSQEKDKLFLYVPLIVLVNLIVWYKIVVGSYVTLLKGTVGP